MMVHVYILAQYPNDSWIPAHSFGSNNSPDQECEIWLFELDDELHSIDDKEPWEWNGN